MLLSKRNIFHYFIWIIVFWRYEIVQTSYIEGNANFVFIQASLQPHRIVFLENKSDHLCRRALAPVILRAKEINPLSILIIAWLVVAVAAIAFFWRYRWGFYHLYGVHQCFIEFVYNIIGISIRAGSIDIDFLKAYVFVCFEYPNVPIPHASRSICNVEKDLVFAKLNW